MTDKTFDTIPREVIELGSKLTAAELRCVIDMLKANLYGDAAGKCQPKDAEKEIQGGAAMLFILLLFAWFPLAILADVAKKSK